MFSASRLNARPTVFRLVGFATLVPAATSLAADADPAPPKPVEGYQLRWSDEFDRDGAPSPENWSFETGFVRNKEAQWYQADNARCENGLLVIEARRERLEVDPQSGSRPAPPWALGRTHAEYTSASLKTRDKHEWLYGRFVMRARVPVSPGAWPAFWTLGHGRWPACGEVDVMECYDDSILANVAWLGRWGKAKWDAAKLPIERLGDPSWAQRFHEWRMDWDEESIDLYVDGRLLNTTSLADTVNADPAAENPFHKPHYLLVNLAIGGVHGGDPAESEFPIRYEIDYVRVYQVESSETVSDD